MVVVAMMPPLMTGAATRALARPIRGMISRQEAMAMAMARQLAATDRHSCFSRARSMVVPMLNSSMTMEMGPRVVRPACLMISAGITLNRNRTRKVIIITNKEESRALVSWEMMSPKAKTARTISKAVHMVIEISSK